MDLDLPARVSLIDFERWMTGGTNGVRARFSAIGAGEYYYEHASARHYDQSEAELKSAGPDQVGQWSRTAAGGQRVHFWWDDCAGEMSLAAAYAEHLLVVRAHQLDLLGSEEPTRPGPERGYVEVGGRLAMREGAGLRLQAIRSRDRTNVLADAMSDAQRAAWSALADGCACPACAEHEWTEADADEIAARLEAGDMAGLLELHRCLAMTPRLRDVLLRSSARLQDVQPNIDEQREYWAFWRQRHLVAARPEAEALLAHADPLVRASARGVLVRASEEEEGVRHVREALADAPLVARASIASWICHPSTRDGSLATWSERLVRPLAPAMIDALDTTADAQLATLVISLISSYPRVVDADVFARFKKSLARWAKDPITKSHVASAKTVRKR